MNARERFLALSLGIMMGLVVLFVVGYQFVYVPLASATKDNQVAEKELADRTRELGDEEAKIKHAEELSPRLSVWELASLPESDPNVTQDEFIRATKVSYEKQLSEIFKPATAGAIGFKSVTVTPGEADVKGGVNQKSNDKTPVYYSIKFTVQGNTNLEGLLRGLEKFYEARFLHQIRGFTIKKTALTARRGPGANAGGDLDVTLNIDAFVVLGSDKHAAENLADKLKEEKTPIVAADKIARDLLLTAKKIAREQLNDESRARELLASKKMAETLKNFGTATTLLATNKLAEQLGSITPSSLAKMGVPELPSVLSPNRSGFEESLRNNIFVGPAAIGSTGGTQREKPEEVLPFVKFTSYQEVGPRRTIHLVDQGKRDPDTTKKSGFQETPLWIGGLTNSVTFNVVDKFGNVLNRCSVIDIQKRLFFFYSNNRFYRMELGQSISEGLEQPVTQVNRVLGALGTAVAPKDGE